MAYDHDDFDKEQRHPAYGNIAFFRTQGGAYLYDSPLHHNNFITMEITPASFQRGLSNRWHHSSTKPILRVAMSYTQFAEAISAMNTTGTPCTLLEYRDEDGKMLQPRLDAPDSDRTTHVEEVDKAVEATAGKVADIINKLDAILASKTVKKGDVKDLRGQLAQLHMHVDANLPHMQKSFYEAMAKVESRVKTEIVAVADHVVHTRGLQSLGIENGAQLMGVQEDMGLLEEAKAAEDETES